MCFQELAHIVWGCKSEICRAGQQSGDLEKVMFRGEIPFSVVPGAGDGGWGWEWRGREGSPSLLLGPQIHE